MTRRKLAILTAALLAVIGLAGATVLARDTFGAPKTITAYFTSATAIYPSDEVRVAGVKVGTIENIEPQGGQVKMTLKVDHDLRIPADAKAVIMAANLISARYVELTPAYRSSNPKANGATMDDNAVIPVDRTAVPVEWDEVKTQLMRMATELGPNGQVSTPAIARFIDSAAAAFSGNGDKFRQTLNELSGVGRILADGSGNIAATVKNLQTFVTALRGSNPQIVEFQGRFETLSGVLNENRSDLDAAVKNLSSALGDVQGFLAETRDKTSEQVQRLADVTSNLAEHRKDLEQLLHVAPTAIANGYADYNPDTGTILGSVSFNNFSNPLMFVCASIGAVKNTTASETAKLCSDYLGPAMKLLNFNNLPIPLNPILGPAPQNITYSDPALAPGGAGPSAAQPEQPPAMSAYTGLNGDEINPPAQQAPSVENLLMPNTTPGPLPPPDAPAGVPTPGGTPPE